MSFAAGLGTFAGGIASGLFNRSSAREQMDFQSRMRSTAHQAEVEDLRKAGLNPILSANAGAATPAGASSEMDNAIGQGIESAMAARRLKEEIGVMESDKAMKIAQAGAAEAAQARDNATAKQTNTATKILEMSIPTLEKKNKYEQRQYEYDIELQDLDNINRRVQETMGSINSAKDAVTRFGNKTKNGPVIRSERQRYYDSIESKDGMERFYRNHNQQKGR